MASIPPSLHNTPLCIPLVMDIVYLVEGTPSHITVLKNYVLVISCCRKMFITKNVMLKSFKSWYFFQNTGSPTWTHACGSAGPGGIQRSACSYCSQGTSCNSLQGTRVPGSVGGSKISDATLAIAVKAQTVKASWRYLGPGDGLQGCSKGSPSDCQG